MEYYDIHWHPALVHFPIALFVIAFLMEAASFLWKKDALHRTALHVYICAVAIAPVTVLTGLWEAQHEKLKHPLVDLHRNLALATMYVSWVSAVLLWFIHKRFQPYLRICFLFLLLLAAVLVTLAAYNGGRLVYEYGIGVEL